MSQTDSLILLRNSISTKKPPHLSTVSNPQDAPSHTTESFVDATYLYFSHPVPQCLALTTTTRFISTAPDTQRQEPVDLRSIYFAWLHKDVTVSEYIAKATELDRSLSDGSRVRALIFAERLDLITWLEGASDESEHIKAPDGAPGSEDAAARAVEIVSGAGVPVVPGAGQAVAQQTAGGRQGKVIDVRLQAIYNGERNMKDHNSILRGIKPTVRTVTVARPRAYRD